MSEEKFLGRIIKEKYVFENKSEWGGMLLAQQWCGQNGYLYGSTSIDRQSGGNTPVAIMIGGYDIPEKWHNMTKDTQNSVDGVMVSDDWRAKSVTVYIFNTIPVI